MIYRGENMLVDYITKYHMLLGELKICKSYLLSALTVENDEYEVHHIINDALSSIEKTMEDINGK